MAHAWWSFYNLYTGEREKNTKINVTFSLSGWAMPFLQRRPGLWQMLRLSPRTESPWSVCLHRVRGKTFPAYLPVGPISRPWAQPGRLVSPGRTSCWDTANLTPRLPGPALQQGANWTIYCLNPEDTES